MLTIRKAFIVKKSQCLEQLMAKHTNTVYRHDVERLGSAVFLYKMSTWLCLHTHKYLQTKGTVTCYVSYDYRMTILQVEYDYNGPKMC